MKLRRSIAVKSILAAGILVILYISGLISTGNLLTTRPIIPDITEDVVAYCTELGATEIIRQSSVVSGISSDNGSICNENFRNEFLNSGLDFIELNESIHKLSRRSCRHLTGLGQSAGWRRYTKINTRTNGLRAQDSVKLAIDGVHIDLAVEQIEKPTARYHLIVFDDPPVDYNDRTEISKQGLAILDNETAERISEQRSFLLWARREHHQPIVSFLKFRPFYRSKYAQGICFELPTSLPWPLINKTIKTAGSTQLH